jgi:hypothetical protein
MIAEERIRVDQEKEVLDGKAVDFTAPITLLAGHHSGDA